MNSTVKGVPAESIGIKKLMKKTWLDHGDGTGQSIMLPVYIQVAQSKSASFAPSDSSNTSSSSIAPKPMHWWDCYARSISLPQRVAADRAEAATGRHNGLHAVVLGLWQERGQGLIYPDVSGDIQPLRKT
ncbi:hypothetical protein LTR66_015145 [Elasticomyces elasticus]|nr:hypothetical protein LTR66_015145 [Elasticomyces elasticus]